MNKKNLLLLAGAMVAGYAIYTMMKKKGEKSNYVAPPTTMKQRKEALIRPNA